MKVTKTIREYVEYQVNLKMEQSELFRSLSTIRRKDRELREQYDSKCRVVRDEYDRKMRELYDAYQNALNSQKYSEVSDELNKKKRVAIMDILTTMELGGTKAELMEMINNLKF